MHNICMDGEHVFQARTMTNRTLCKTTALKRTHSLNCFPTEIQVHPVCQFLHHFRPSRRHCVTPQTRAGKDFHVMHVVLALGTPHQSRGQVLSPEGCMDEIITFHGDVE